MTASEQIDQLIAAITDWRGETFAKVRKCILSADPDIVEDVKWRKPSNPNGVPVWEKDGLICTGETYKSYVKLTFAKGAALADPTNLFNASLDGNVRRAIDIREGDTLDETAFRALIRAAIAYNQSQKKKTPAGPRSKVQITKKT